MGRNELIALRNGNSPSQRHGYYWSAEEQDKMVQQFHDGYGISELALLYGRTESAIFHQLDRMSLLTPQYKPRNRQSKNAQPQCLCPFCAITSCENCGKECAHAGNL